MVPSDTKQGPMWRIAPSGTTQCYFGGFGTTSGTARIFGRGRNRPWAKAPMIISAKDLFLTRDEALAEYRRRRKAAGPHESLNLTSEV